MKEKNIYDFKVLFVCADYLLAVIGYRINKYSFEGKWTESVVKIKDKKYGKWADYKLSRRLMRAEITSLYELYDGNMISIAKKGIFCKEGGEQIFRKVFSVPRGSKPLNICILPNGHMFWGEYFQNMNNEDVNIYGSMDNGQTWTVVYTFEAGNINHIHGLFFDKFTNRIWVLTGDRKNECIIGYTDDEFQTIHEVLRGGQEYRSCQLFFYKDFIVYATDSQYIENEIRAINRETLQITTLAKIQGSAIKGGQTGDVSYLSTTVEPSEVNKCRFSHIWVTKDGLHWVDKYQAEKDCWPSIFQFGTFEFPQNAYCDGKLWFSGRALKGFDNKSTYIEL